MDNKDYVTPQQARRLKALGFRELVMDYYYNGKFNGGPYAQNLWDDFNNDSRQVSGPKYMSAPHLYNAMRWLIENGYYVNVQLLAENVWSFSIEDKNGVELTDTLESYLSYEYALSAGIDEALTLLEKHNRNV